jgi:heme exporter protein A
MSLAQLEVRSLACERGQKTLFQDVNFQLGAGQWLHLEGANGVGKTSLLRILCGLAPAAAGDMLWRGLPISDPNSDYRSQRLFMGHQLALKEELSALENLMCDAAISGRALTRDEALSALAEQGLAGREHLPLKVLSQGQKRRCALARLRPGQARLWLLDEPFVALDAAAVERLRLQLSRHVALGGAVLYTSHQPVVLDGEGRSYRLGA